MIEIIFVIVVMGILAVVAVPKLMATKDDATDVTDCKNIAVCTTDLIAEYTAKLMATKNDSEACKRAEASTRNSISITVASDHMTVSGAPNQCSHLNITTKFGGTRISL